MTLGEGPVQYTNVIWSRGTTVPHVSYHSNIGVPAPRDTFVHNVQPGFVYTYALASTNELGIVRGGTITLVAGNDAPAAPATVATDVANVVDGRIQVVGRVQSSVLPTHYWAEWDTLPGMGTARSTPRDTILNIEEREVTRTFNVPTPRTYYVRVVAQNPYGRTNGNVVSVAYGAPAAPQNFALRLYGEGTVEATWTHDGMNMSRWRLLRRPLGQSVWAVARSNPDTTLRSLRDYQYDVNVDQYEYMLQACQLSACASSPILQVSGTRLFTPTNLRTTSTAPGNVTLAWDASDDLVSEYVLSRRRAGSATPVQFVTRSTTYTDTTAQAGVLYYYSLRSRNSVGMSPATSELAVMPN